MSLVAGDLLQGLLVRQEALPTHPPEIPLDQHRLQMSLRLQALEHAVAVFLPILFPLYARDDRSGRADAMSCGVPAYDLLPFFGYRFSLMQCQPCTSPLYASKSHSNLLRVYFRSKVFSLRFSYSFWEPRISSLQLELDLLATVCR